MPSQGKIVFILWWHTTKDTTAFPQCIVSHEIFCTVVMCGLLVMTDTLIIRSHSKLLHFRYVFVTNDPRGHLNKIFHWKQCIVGRSQYRLWWHPKILRAYNRIFIIKIVLWLNRVVWLNITWVIMSNTTFGLGVPHTTWLLYWAFCQRPQESMCTCTYFQKCWGQNIMLAVYI